MLDHARTRIVSLTSLLLLGLAACSRTEPETVEFETNHAALITPPLANERGTLCLDDQLTNQHSTGPDAAGWVRVGSWRSRGVLGGTAETTPSSEDVYAQTNLEFKIIDVANGTPFGMRPQVCAEIAARTPCDSDLICWHGDGSWTFESRRSGQLHEALCDRQYRDGGAGFTVVARSTDSNKNAALVAGKTYGITVVAWRDGTDAMTIVFSENGVAKSVSLPFAFGGQVGFAGYRADRFRIDVRLRGVDQFNTEVTAQNRSYEGSGGRTCSYRPVASRAPAVVNLQVEQRPCHDGAVIRWNSVGAGTHYEVFRDGHPVFVQWNPETVLGSWRLYLPESVYNYQVGYYDGSGVLSQLANLREQTSWPCTNTMPGIANKQPGRIALATVLLACNTAPTAGMTAGVRARLYDDAYSLKNFVAAMSGNRYTVTGNVITNPDGSWIAANDMRFCQEGTEPRDGEWNQLLTRAGLVDPAQSASPYDAVAFTGHPNGARNRQNGRLLWIGQRPNEGVDFPSFSHELLHAYGLGHASGWVCGPGASGPGGLAGPSLANLEADPIGGTCKVYEYGDTREPMGSPPLRFGQMHSMHRYRLGWLDPFEIATDINGGTYTLRNPTATGLQQVKIWLEANSYYFLDFSTHAWFNYPPPGVPAVLDPTTEGVHVRLWRNAFAGDNESANRVAVGQEGYADAVSIVPSDVSLTGGVSRRAPLKAGDTFCDPHRRVSVTVTSLSAAAGAVVQVKRGACDVCGDGLTGGSEQCDDGNAVTSDGCFNCRIMNGFRCTTPSGGRTACMRTCGNGIIEADTHEQCDDGNSTSFRSNGTADGCTGRTDEFVGACQVMAGFTCTGQPSVCTQN